MIPAYRFGYPRELGVTIVDALLYVPGTERTRPEDRPPFAFARCLLDCWLTLGRPDHFTLVGHAIALDQHHLDEIDSLAREHPRAVIAMPYLRRPLDPDAEKPVWSNGTFDALGRPRYFPSHCLPPPNPLLFGLGCTCLPRRLLDVVALDHDHWTLDQLAEGLPKLAQEMNVSCIAGSREVINLDW